MINRIENIFLYVCSACWLFMAVFLSTIYISNTHLLPITRPFYQTIAYAMAIVMFPLVPIPFLLRISLFGFVLAILPGGV
jgi:hypothetical protein